MGKPQQAEAAYADVASLGEAEGAAPTPYLAYAYEKLGRSDDAIAVYVHLLAEQESADLHAYLGSLYAEKGAADLARGELERALELNPQQTLAQLKLDNLASAEGDLARAAAAYETYLSQVESAAAHDDAAQAYEQLGNLPDALRHLQAAARLEPSNAALLQRLANVANLLNLVDDATLAAGQALRLRPEDHTLYFLAGRLAYKRCDVTRAVAALERSVELTRTNSVYTGYLGNYLLAQGNIAQAQPHLAQLRAAPAGDYLAHWLAGSLLALGDLNAENSAAAQAEYAAALAAPNLPPTFAVFLHSAQGQLAYTTQDYTSAQAEFAAALAQAPDYGGAALALGDLALLEGDVDAAEQHYRQAQGALPAYAPQYGSDWSAVLTPLLRLRLALAARQRGNTAG